ncbi:MAG: NUDIX domain-containing protein [Pseudomonadales bacterium]|nr:NUDIX domain-containing protein [Pseudomonadales bacterium]
MNKLVPQFSEVDVEILKREKGFDSFLRIDQLQLKHRLCDGGWSETINRELAVRPEAVGVLLFDPVRDEIVLVRQFRVGTLSEESSPWILELVAGMVDKDESLESVALRETREESNCEIVELTRICDYYNSPGVSDEKVTLFCGKIDSSNAGGVFGLAEEHEDIEVVVLAHSEAQQAVEAGIINNAMSIIALQWLALNKEKVVRNWQ